MQQRRFGNTEAQRRKDCPGTDRCSHGLILEGRYQNH